MNVGDTVKHRLKIWDPNHRPGDKPAETTVEATVVYIHPERRYYTLEYIMPGGRFRESFQFTN